MADEFINILPPNIARVLSGFVEHAQTAFADDLRAIVLYGSGAEGKLRPRSDVNLLLVLSAFDQQQADQLREPLRLAETAIRLKVMFLLESELRPAIEAFAVKFADIMRRRRVLHGEDPFVGISVSRSHSIVRLRQVLLNLTLRLRESYISRGLREEQLAALLAEMAGPLRSCAATLLELEGMPADSPKQALQQVAASLPEGAAGIDEIARISEAREVKMLAPGVAGPTLFQLIELAQSMRIRSEALS
jgi:predicted nucleotidyltransferase